MNRQPTCYAGIISFVVDLEEEKTGAPVVLAIANAAVAEKAEIIVVSNTRLVALVPESFDKVLHGLNTLDQEFVEANLAGPFEVFNVEVQKYLDEQDCVAQRRSARLCFAIKATSDQLIAHLQGVVASKSDQAEAVA